MDLEIHHFLGTGVLLLTILTILIVRLFLAHRKDLREKERQAPHFADRGVGDLRVLPLIKAGASSALLDTLQEVIAYHLDYAVARAHYYCRVEVQSLPVERLGKLCQDPNVKEQLLQQLGAGSSHALLLLYWTSDTYPQPLNARGKLYVFVFHPQNYALLRTFILDWGA